MLSTGLHAVVASARGHAIVAGRVQQRQHRIQETAASMTLQRPLLLQEVSRPAQQQVQAAASVARAHAGAVAAGLQLLRRVCQLQMHQRQNLWLMGCMLMMR
jgi:restriction endonuclease Mrr